MDQSELINLYIKPRLSATQVEVQLPNDSKSYKIDFCTIKNSSNGYKKNIIFLTGFGSGWTGIMHLAINVFLFMGYNIYAISLPGYGNSDDLTTEELRRLKISKDFLFEAKILSQWMKEVLPNESAHCVCHSEGAKIASKLAYLYPEAVSSLIMLAPVGFKNRSATGLFVSFILNGFLHYFAFRNDALWNQIKGYLPKQKGALFSSISRIEQRLSEWKRLCKGDEKELQTLADSRLPMLCIHGKKDFVYKTLSCTGINYVTTPYWHNLTMYGSEKTAEIINLFISEHG